MKWANPKQRLESLTELNGCLHNGHNKIKLEQKAIKKYVKNLSKIGKKIKKKLKIKK